MKVPEYEIVLLSSGHQALDSRVFDKEAVSLAKHFAHVRVVAAHDGDEVRNKVTITALPPHRTRLCRFLLQPLRCFWQARGPGKRLLILHDAELLPWAPLVKLLTGWRIIYDVHEDFSHLMMHRHWVPPRLRRSIGHGVGVLEKVFSHACDGVVGVTTVLTDYFVNKRRETIYNLPSRAFIAQAGECARPLAEREYDVVHLGTLSSERLEYLCAVLSHLFAMRPHARALILGVRDDQAQCLRERFPAERVTVVGKLPYQQIATYLGNARVGVNVHPVLHPHLRCAIPVKVFEYMAAGCNVVTSFLPELHHLLEHDGAALISTLYASEPERFAEELGRVLDDADGMERRRQALQALVGSRWNWDHEAEKLVHFVTRILQQKEYLAHEQVPDHQC